MKTERWFLALVLVLALTPLALAGGKSTAVLARDLDAALAAGKSAAGTPVVIQSRDSIAISLWQVWSEGSALIRYQPSEECFGSAPRGSVLISARDCRRAL